MSESKSFAEASEYLGVATGDLNILRDHGLVVTQSRGSRQTYPLTPLTIARNLLRLGRERGWPYATLACYADLAFAAEVGRAVLLPMSDENQSQDQASANWLETHYAEAVLRDMEGTLEASDGVLVALLRAVCRER